MPGRVQLQPEDPRRIGSYELTGRLGEGGQGAVYAARGADGTKVAIKLLFRSFADGDARAVFGKEMDAARTVAEFCTARVLDCGMHGQRPYIVTEFIEGPTLREALKETGPLDGPDLMRLAIGTATALAAIHRAGVVHRDFKPDNVIMDRGGPRVIDFGISRIVEAVSVDASQIVGTPAYMAPEQMLGRSITPAIDIWAWAATITVAATGRPPFGTGTFPEMSRRITQDAPDLRGLDGPLRETVATCLQKDPARRPGALDLLAGLLGYGGPAARSRPPAADVIEAGHRTMGQPFRPPLPGSGADRAFIGGRLRRSRGVRVLAACIAAGATTLLMASVAVTATVLADRDGRARTPPASSKSSSTPSSSPSPTSPSPTSSAPVTQVPATFAGSWEGTVTYTAEDDTKDSFSAVLSLYRDRMSVAEYRGFGCWVDLRVERVAGDTLIMKETNGSGCNDAYPLGFIVLDRTAEGTLKYTWFSTKEDALTRTDANGTAVLR